MTDSITLKVQRRIGSASFASDTFDIQGDANFIWEEIGVLLTDPLCIGFQMSRPAVIIDNKAQVEG